MDRKKFAEDGLQADIPALAYRNILLKELVVGIDLELDEVGWLDGLLQFTELDAFRHGFGAVPRVFGLAGLAGRVHPPINGNKISGIEERPLFEVIAMTETCLFCSAGRQMFVRKTDEASEEK